MSPLELIKKLSIKVDELYKKSLLIMDFVSNEGDIQDTYIALYNNSRKRTEKIKYTDVLKNITDVQDGNNISIDKSDPLKPIINSEVEVGGRNYLLNSGFSYPFLNNNIDECNLIQGVENKLHWVSGTLVSNNNFYVTTYFNFFNANYFSKDLTGVAKTTQSIYVMPTHDMYISLSYDSPFFCKANEWVRIFIVEPTSFLSVDYTRALAIKAIWNNDGVVPSNARIYYKNQQIELGNVVTDYKVAPEDIQYQIETSKLYTNTSINTSTILQDLSQNGRHVLLRNEGVTNFKVTVDSEVTATYQKSSIDMVSFLSTSDYELILVDGTDKLDGGIGSTATITVDNGKAYLRISNV